MKVFLPTVLMLLLLSVPVMSQERREPTLGELKNSLLILNLRIENMELRYTDLKQVHERVTAKISQLESAALKKVPELKEKK